MTTVSGCRSSVPSTRFTSRTHGHKGSVLGPRKMKVSPTHMVTDDVDVHPGDFIGWTCEAGQRCPMFYDSYVLGYAIRMVQQDNITQPGDLVYVSLLTAQQWSVGVRVALPMTTTPAPPTTVPETETTEEMTTSIEQTSASSSAPTTTQPSTPAFYVKPTPGQPDDPQLSWWNMTVLLLLTLILIVTLCILFALWYIHWGAKRKTAPLLHNPYDTQTFDRLSQNTETSVQDNPFSPLTTHQPSSQHVVTSHQDEPSGQQILDHHSSQRTATSLPINPFNTQTSNHSTSNHFTSQSMVIAPPEKNTHTSDPQTSNHQTSNHPSSQHMETRLQDPPDPQAFNPQPFDPDTSNHSSPRHMEVMLQGNPSDPQTCDHTMSSIDNPDDINFVTVSKPKMSNVRMPSFF